MGTNIGRVVLKVYFMSKSPFAPQSRQEEMHYFDEDNFKGFATVNLAPVPSPIGGFRIIESLCNYDNFIEDTEGTPLETGTFKQTQVISGTNENGEQLTEEEAAAKSQTADIPVDAMASLRAGLETGSVSAEQKEFFTWQVTQNLFKLTKGSVPEGTSIEDTDPETGKKRTDEEKVALQDKERIGNNPVPRKFTEGPRNDNSPEWTYMLFSRPDGNNKAKLLTPYMKKSAPDDKNSVHWGAKMKTALALNQPFNVIYYFTKRDASVADQTPEMTTRYRFVDIRGQELTDLKLTRSLYFAIEMGTGTQDHAMLLFKSGSEPMFFRMFKEENSQSSNAVLSGKFTGFNSEKIFDPNNKFFSVSVEPVAGNLVVRSNIFGDVPWLILSNPLNPIFVGHGPLAVYGGNVQAGFAMRPIQYLSKGTCVTPKVTFTIIGQGGTPTCTTALKGAGQIEQDRSTENLSFDNPFSSTAEVHAVDAERVNGQRAKSIVEVESNRATQDAGVQRVINTSTKAVDDPNVDPGSQPGHGTNLRTEQSYQSTIEMFSGNMQQGNGYIVKNGRSPYIWRLTCSVPASTTGADPTDELDVSCDVMSVDLNWNATSYNEIVHSGNLKLLNRRQASEDNTKSPTNYRAYMNRAIYLRIEAYWEGGAGHDPGGSGRQIFEGLTTGSTIETDAQREVVNFKIEDYMNVLQGGKFVLSPAYDGMSVPLAVQDIVQQTGLGKNRILRNSKQISEANLSEDLGIPLVNINEKPRFRFRDGTSYKDAILKFAKLDFKCIYFDNLGRFHLDDVPGGVFGDLDFGGQPVQFWSSVKSAGGNLSQVVWNNVSFSRLINDVYNAFSVKSVDKKTLGRISVGDVYTAGIFNPNAEGYLGYRKHLVVEDAALGSVDAVFRYLDNYRRRLFIPPLTARFSTYGYSGLKPLDIIQLDGQNLRIMNIQTRLNAAENQFWMDIEGEWFFSLGKDEDPFLHRDTFNDSVGANSSLDPGTASTL